jgi:hypothetical protein
LRLFSYKNMFLPLFLAGFWLAGTARATAIFDFDSPTGNLGFSNMYTSGGVSITASAFTVFGTTDLYGKADGGDENGLGLSDEPLSHEITPGSFIQLDLSDVLGDGPFTINFGSTTGIDIWQIVQTNTPGTLLGATPVLFGDNETGHTISPTDRYLDITAFSGDVLLASLVLDDPPAIPEPASAILITSGLVLVGIGRLRRKS